MLWYDCYLRAKQCEIFQCSILSVFVIKFIRVNLETSQRSACMFNKMSLENKREHSIMILMIQYSLHACNLEKKEYDSHCIYNPGNTQHD